MIAALRAPGRAEVLTDPPLKVKRYLDKMKGEDIECTPGRKVQV